MNAVHELSCIGRDDPSNTQVPNYIGLCRYLELRVEHYQEAQYGSYRIEPTGSRQPTNCHIWNKLKLGK